MRMMSPYSQFHVFVVYMEIIMALFSKTAFSGTQNTVVM